MKSYTKDWLTELCQSSYSIREVLCKAGRKPDGGGSAETVKRKIKEFDIDISHFTGKLWSKGKTQKEDDRIQSREKYQIADIFIPDSPATRRTIRGYILRHNLIPYECKFCGNKGQWRGQEIALDLDHINGINNDHRLENLRFLCPNCHATTNSYRGKNKKHS